jgi:hypothetical protein
MCSMFPFRDSMRNLLARRDQVLACRRCRRPTSRRYRASRVRADFTALNFAQRFTGTFADDGTTIAATWETSPERAHWSTDFELTYTRIAHAGVSDNGACNPRTSETVCTPPLSEQRRMLHLDGR